MNTFGTHFRLTDFGETHGECIGGIIDGCPAGIKIDEEFVQQELARRSHTIYDKLGTAGDNTRREPDKIRFISGIYEGKSTGAPIAFVIKNADVKVNESANHVLKPSHNSYVLREKFGHTCNEQGGHFTARQTASRVVGGAIAKLLLQKKGISIEAETVAVAEVSDGDTAGAVVACVIRNVPAGWGEPMYGGLDALLAAALLSIPACKGFEIGEGFHAAAMCGSAYNDAQTAGFDFRSNHDGGVQSGISNGQDIVFRAAFKPIPTLRFAQPTIDYKGNPATYTGTTRNDTSVVPRVLPVVEAMAAMVIADQYIIHNS